MTDEVTKALEEMETLVSYYAKAEADRSHLEEFKKSKLSILMKKYEPSNKTTASQEREARADPEYIELLDGLKVATEEAVLYKFKIKCKELRFEKWRTLNANKRARITSGIGG